MLRVGLTGELGSGKSTVARLLAEHGALVLSSDEMGRAMMQPGQPVYQSVVDHFGATVLLPDGSLNRRALASLAFDPAHPRIEELNALIHPAVLQEQERRIMKIAVEQPKAIVVIESALIFTTKSTDNQPWRRRFDHIVLVTAPDAIRIARFVERMADGRVLSASERTALERDARQRLAAQRISAEVSKDCLLLENLGSLEELTRHTEEVFQLLCRFKDDVQE